MSLDEIKDYVWDIWWGLIERFNVDDKCNKCKMCMSEKISYEYDEWEIYCLNEKGIYEIEYCFIPLWYSKIKAKLFKEKILKRREQNTLDEYAKFGEYLEEEYEAYICNSDITKELEGLDAK